MIGPRRLGWDEPAPADLFEHLADSEVKDEPVDVMTAYAASLTDAELIDLRDGNLVESQARVIRAELAKRGLNG